MSSSNKSKTTVSFSASDVPKFDGRNFLQWKERITGVLLYSDVMDIIRGTLVEPPTTDAPAPPAAPAANADATALGSMAALLWLNSLPLATGATSQESVYQRMMEKYTSDNGVSDMDLDSVFAATRSAWTARFGHLPSGQQPRKGTLYLKKENRDQKQKAPNTQTAQRNTAIKGKGKEPSHSDQQNAG
ncbi:hypothetical protein CVT26_000641, partial [Gymnopilus dilepis]